MWAGWGFRSCGLFGIPFMCATLGSVPVGCFGFCLRELFCGSVRVGGLGARSCGLFWVSFVRGVLGSVGVRFSFVCAIWGSDRAGSFGLRRCELFWDLFVWVV